MDTTALVEGVLAGQRRALARLLTRVEDGSEDELRAAVRLLHPRTGSARIVGVTGAPGVGKSTLTNALVRVWRDGGRTVAVLAVDPSSPFSGGALLGDRVRMQDHALDEGVFIRSMASRGHLGGLAWATPQALLVLDAAGFDIVVIETVGVGQAEVEVASVADSTIVVLAPGMGDAVQAAKAGILEVADVFCVNKADHEGAERTVRDLRDMQRLGEVDRPVPVHATVAATGRGVEQLADALDEHHGWLCSSGRREQRQLERARLELREIALGIVRRQFSAVGEGDLAERLAGEVARRAIDPYRAADQLVAAL